MDAEAPQNAQADSTDQWIQCSRSQCQKWRRQINGSVSMSDDQEWLCTDNVDPLHNSCQAPEEEEIKAEPTVEPTDDAYVLDI